MEMDLSEEQLELLSSNISAEELEEALTLLLLESGESDVDLEELGDFCRMAKDCGGDLTKLYFRTHEPVSIKQFITDPYFLNYKIVDEPEDDEEDKHRQIGIWRPVFDDMVKVINGGYTEVILTGAIGTGKTTHAQILSAYDLYLLSCERYPQLRFGLLPGRSIQQVCLNVTDTLAKRVTYGEYVTMLDGIKYFKDHFARKPDNKSEMLFPRGVRVNYAAAFSGKIMGENTIGGIVDELNFMNIVKESKKQRDGGEFNQAIAVYRALSRRLKSRYDVGDDTSLPSHLCLVSSKGYPDDFTEQRITEIEEDNDGRSVVFNHPQWEVKKRAIFKKQPWFRVEIGNDRNNTRIVPKGEKPRAKSEVIKVPEFYRSEFKKDPEGALRDFAGRATLTITPFFGNREKVWEMGDLFNELEYQSPFVDRMIDLTKGYPALLEGYEVPNPEVWRACHIDLALTRDYCGIAVGHVYKTDFVRKRDKHRDKMDVEEVPFVAYDVVLTIKPPKKGEIQFTDIRNILYLLRDLGLPIKWVTFDQFQSKDSQQMLRRKGFKTGQLSVEDLATYEDFKQAVYEGRIASPEHPIAFTEMCKLEADYKKGKVDHLPNERKDTADGMCGVYTFLVRKRSSWRTSNADASERDDRDNDTPLDTKRPRPSTTRRSVERRSVGKRPNSVRR